MYLSEKYASFLGLHQHAAVCAFYNILLPLIRLNFNHGIGIVLATSAITIDVITE